MTQNTQVVLNAEDKVNDLLADLFELDPKAIRDDWTHEDIALWDSLQHLRMIAAMEQEFGIKFSMAEIRSIENVGQIRSIMRKKVGR
jgi:acyl carrier protein